MRRIAIKPRPNWQQTVEAQGLSIHTLEGHKYWDEEACYLFTPQEIATLESSLAELYRICVEATGAVIENGLWEAFSIPPIYADWIRQSWEDDQPSLYGRFDLSWDGSGQPKMLEFNADTPTSLVESAVIQWFWLEDRIEQGVADDWDQFNSIHELLIESWAEIATTLELPRLHVASMTDQPEDLMTATYMMDVALQAGLEATMIDMSTIGFDPSRRQFLDQAKAPIELIFKLYPWEWMLRENFGRALPQSNCKWVEPPWKMIMSNKAILPLLWEMFPNHPNLLWAGWQPPDRKMETYVEKPVFGREGANVKIVKQSGQIIDQADGPYDATSPFSRVVYQEFSRVNRFQNRLPILGGWIVGGEPAGLGIREDDGLITGNFSRFVPHAVVSD